MKGQVLSIDLINSIIGFILIVGIVVMIINSSNLISIYEYELFKISFMEANRLMFSTLGIVDERGFLKNVSFPYLSGQRDYIQDLLISSGHNIGIDLYIGNIRVGVERCGNKSTKLSTTRYLIYNNILYNITLVGCK